jgi:hypothetical protein
VTQRADVSRQTWYRYWRADESTYLDELVGGALETVAPVLGARFRTDDTLVADGRTAADALARAHFAVVSQQRIAMPYLVAVVLALEDRVLEAEGGMRPTSAPRIVRDYQARVNAALVDAYRALLEWWRRRPRPDMDVAGIVELVSALADGFALRQIPDPVGAIDDAFARHAVRLLEALTLPRYELDPA